MRFTGGLHRAQRRGARLDFSRDGTNFVFLQDYHAVKELPLSGIRERYVTQQLVNGAAYAPDGDGIIVMENRWDGDSWLVERADR